MNGAKFALLQIVALCLLIGPHGSAFAKTNVYVGVGVGNRDSHRGGRPGHVTSRHHRRFRPAGHRWVRRHYRLRRTTIIFGGGYRYDWGPDYYVVASPTVIKRTPVVVEKQIVVVQPKEDDEDTQALFEALRYRKAELLKRLATGDKEQRLEAIEELAGFFFDDTVRQAIENVLLSDPDPQLRKEAAQALGEVKNTKALHALEKARVEDSSEDVRKATDRAIKKIEGS
jgi:hypothetical protein